MSSAASRWPAVRLGRWILLQAVGIGLLTAQPLRAAEDPSAALPLSEAQRFYDACTRLAAARWPVHPIPRRAHLQRLDAARPQCIDHAQFLATFGALWLEEGEANQALIWLERSLLLDPGNLGAQADHALALAALGERAALTELLEAWRNRTDIPAALRERLMPSRTASVTDPLPKVRLGGFQDGGWASHREATMLLGYESNLDHSPKLSEITLTPPDGPVALPLDTPLQPRRGAAITSDLSWQLARSPQSGQVWRAGINMGARAAPGENRTNWGYLQLAGSLSQQWAPWRGQVELGASWVGGPLNEPYRVGRLGLSMERDALGCMVRVAAEGEARTQRETSISDGRTVGLLWSTQCPVNGRRQWSWGAAARAAVDRPVDPLRAGGVQRLWSAGARMTGLVSNDVRIESNLRFTRTRDDEGYNPLLEDFARRELRQVQLSVEIVRPLTLPGGIAADSILQILATQQRSNLSVFRYTGFSAYGGLRWAW